MERTDIHGGQSPGEWSDQPENLNIPFAAKKPHTGATLRYILRVIIP